MVTYRSSRRQFLHWIPLAVGSVCLAGAKRSPAPRVLSPNDRLNLGLVGVAGYGAFHLAECVRENIVALCDVDTEALASPSLSYPQANLYSDFRRMLDRETLDGVVIASADHTHAVIAAAALRAGCHVYCADPLTRTVSESRSLAELARRSKCVTQLGGSIALPELEDQAARILQTGTLGTVTEVHAWTSRSHGELDASDTDRTMPHGVDYEAWLGPLFARPYRSDYLPGLWRHWWEFGGGTLADSGTGLFTFLHRELGLQAPSRIEAHGPALHLDHTPAWMTCHWTYPRKQPAPPLEVHWYHGGKRPEAFQAPEGLEAQDGVWICGSAGRLLMAGGRSFLWASGEPIREITPPASAAAQPSRICEWADACRSGGRTVAGFDSVGPAMEAMLLGNVAYRTDRKLVWDPKKMIAGNLPDASEYIQHSYRPGWQL